MIGTGAIASARFLDQYAIQFNGSTQCLTIANHPYLADTAGAWSFWIKPTTVLSADGVRVLVSADINSGGSRIINIGLRRHPSFGTGTYLDITVVNPSAAGSSGSSVPILAGSTYHIYYDSNANLYINGSAVTLVTWGVPVTPIWYSALVGGTNRNIALAAAYRPPSIVNPYNGDINDTTYFNAPLTAGEITEVYNAGKRMNPNRWTASLRAKVKSFYPFEQDANDKIGAQNWTPINSPSYVTP